MPLKIKVYSDYVCPFCYLAEFPLRKAIRGRDVEVEWMPFELRPEPKPTLRPEGESLQRAWSQSVYPIARRMGVPIVLPPVSPQPHTHLAFEGYQYAREHGKGNEYNHRRPGGCARSEEHTLNSSHANISYAVFCLKKKSTHPHFS